MTAAPAVEAASAVLASEGCAREQARRRAGAQDGNADKQLDAEHAQQHRSYHHHMQDVSEQIGTRSFLSFNGVISELNLP